MRHVLFCISLLFFFGSCSVSSYSPGKKYAKQQLAEDYSLLKNILEEVHPSLYWYTSPDSINWYFDHYANQIQDSMTEQEFAWKVLAPMVDKIHCGHTSVSMSKAYGRWADGRRFQSFPYYLKVWDDSMAVVRTLIKDSIFAKGTIIRSVNGIGRDSLVKAIFDKLPEDGYANNINFIRMSGNFPYYHRNIFGVSDKYKVEYLDAKGNLAVKDIPAYKPPKDTTKKVTGRKDSIPPRPKAPKRKRTKSFYRSFHVDSSGLFATMEVNAFTKGNLRAFFRRCFKEMKEKNIPNLVLDIRSNSGGRIGLSTLLTKYLSRTSFRVADTVYANSRSLGKYTGHFERKWLNNIQMFFTTRKMKDGKFHLRHFERKCYAANKKYTYKGKVYVLTNGPTFSAATLLANTLKGQEGITLVGEETGGGWHGNNGIMIPEVKLPNTRTRVTMPLFRVVQFQHVPKTGSGVVPDVYIGTNYDALMKGVDHKMKVVERMILEDKQ